MSQTVSNYTPPTLFDLHTGKIGERFKEQLDLCGIQLHAHIPSLAADHIANVNKTLQTNGCFQRDFEIYKNGNGQNSKLQLEYDQALAFLDNDYSDRIKIMPRQKDLPADGIIGCGVEPTMHKRFDTIKEAIESGCKFAALHFIMKDASTREMIEGLIKEKYSNMVRGIPIHFVITNTEIDVLKAGLNQLKNDLENGLKTKNYIMVSDVVIAAKIEGIAKSILTNKKCLGVAASSTNDWIYDMNLYGYGKALGTMEKATIAWAQSAWNFKARQVHAELALYEANKKENRKQAALLAGVAFGCLAVFAKMAFQ